MQKTVAVDGIQLNVFVEGAGLPIVFVHGFPLDHTMWRGQLDTFSKTHRVIAPDLRGFGRSDVTEGTVTMQRFADDLAAVLDALHVDEPISLCGLSMGGYVAFRYVSQYGRRLRSLILCDTRAGADSPEQIENRRKLAQTVRDLGTEPVAKAMLPKLVSAHTTTHRPDVLERLRQMILANQPAGIAAASLGMAARPDSTVLLSRIPVPTLLLVGDEDTITPADEMRDMADRIPEARFITIPQAGHMAPMENPEAVNTAIEEFLKRM